MSVYEILSDIQAHNGLGREYAEKQLHKVPETTSVDRVKFLVERCTGRGVLDVGSASGPLHAKLGEVAKVIFGADRNPTAGDRSAVLDLDAWGGSEIMPFADQLEIDTVVCGEVLEHLSNPGWLLHRIAHSFPNAELIVTAPNAFGKSGRGWMAKGIENVNREHVTWFSWHTLLVLTGRYGYETREWHWYNGDPMTAEGMIFCCRQVPALETACTP